jgi:hypothetical protein
MSSRWNVARILAFSSCLILVGSIMASADDDHGRGGGHRGGTNHFLDVSPWGVSYGFQSRNFGFALGPVGGRAPDYYAVPAQPAFAPGVPYGGFGDYGGYGGYSQPVISGPIASGPVVSSPVIGDAYVPLGTPTTVAPSNNRAVDAPSPSSTKFNSAAETFYRQSVEAFRRGDYPAATKASDHAIVEDSNSGFLRLHASQCLMANGEFEASATALHDGLSMLEPDQWGREIKNFRDLYQKNDYVTHVKNLEKFAAENPKASFANALCAYHFNYLGHVDAAKRHLAAARKADANDPLVKLLSRAIDGEPAEELPEPVSILVPSK